MGSGLPADDRGIIVMNGPPHVPLFSYGTLRNEAVQMASFGRLLSGTPDALTGYVCVPIEIKDADVVAVSGEKFHSLIIETGNPADEVRGTLFLISEVELAAADAYEVSVYKRVQVTLKSGRSAWVYAKARS
jgi:Gamma-glutamyl cyclotransferase, AIG2-like